MAKKEKDILKKLGVPWITKDGFLDMAKFPIDSITTTKTLNVKRSSWRPLDM
jgi:hypothetical protein